MTLASILESLNLTPGEVDTQAVVTLEKTKDGLVISKVKLEVDATVPDATREQFIEAARKAKKNCPISKLINAEITMDAILMDIG